VKQRGPLGESVRDRSELCAVLSVSGLAGSKAKDKVEHILLHTVEVTYGTDGLPNVTQECASHLSRAGKGGRGALSWSVAVVLTLHSAAN
jgi:hypothetical protein